MKKRIVSMLLAIVMVVGLVPAMSPTAAAADHTHDMSVTCQGSGVTFEPLTDSVLNTDIDPNRPGIQIPEGNYYLTEDVSSDEQLEIRITGEVNLCLNGNKFTFTSTDDTVSFLVTQGSLNICDCKGNGSISHNTRSGVSTSTDGTARIYGGTFTGKYGVYNTGSLYAYGGNFSGTDADIYTGIAPYVYLTGEPTLDSIYVQGHWSTGIHASVDSVPYTGGLITIKYSELSDNSHGSYAVQAVTDNNKDKFTVTNDGWTLTYDSADKVLKLAQVHPYHNWDYTSVDEDNDGYNETINATCTVTTGSCDSTANTSITILAPAMKISGDGNSPSATIKDGKTSIGGFSDGQLPSFHYYVKNGDSWDLCSSAPTDPGTYKAVLQSSTTIAEVMYTIAASAHTHSWTYTASGNTITATCQAAGCPETGAKTIVISASDKVYDGTAVTAAVTNTVDSTDYSASIVYEAKTGTLTDGKAVNAGSYTAKITVDGVTASVDFEITPITYTVTATDDGNGTASASPASGAEGAEVTLTATPNDGYQFKEWLVISGGVTVTDDKFTIGTEDVVIEAVFEQVPAPSLNSVSILAVDEAGNPLFGAEMQLLDAENVVVEVWTSTEEAHTIEGLQTNVTYTLHVTEAPDGYIVPIVPGDTVYAQFSINVDGNVSYSNEVAEDGVLLVMLEEPSLYVGGVEMNDGDYLASGADSVSDIAPASGGYAHYSGGVLTLHDYAYEGTGHCYDRQPNDYYHALVYAKAPELEIVLEGSSSFASAFPDAVSDTESYSIYGICAEYSDVTVSGAGSLSIATEEIGMDFPYSTLAVSGGSVQIEAVDGIGNAESVSLSGGSLIVAAEYDGIYSTASIEITGGLLYAVTSGSAADGSFAIDPGYSQEILSVGSGLTILLPVNGTAAEIETGVTEVLIAGSHAFGSTYVRNNTHHWLSCAEEGCPFGADGEFHQHFTGSGYAGHAADGICVCGYDATKEAVLYVGGLGLAEGEYFSTSGAFSTTAPENEGYAHYSNGVLTLKDYEYSGAGYTFTNAEGYEYTAAVYSENALTVELTGVSTLTTDGIGIHSPGNITIRGSGTLNIDSVGDGVESYSGNITVNGGRLNIVSAKDMGIDGNNDGSVTITGGTIRIQAPGDEGIDVDGDGVFTMTAGTLTIDSHDDGIDCGAAINISGGTLTITAGNSGLESGGDTTITGGAITILSNGDDNVDDPYPALLMENGGKLTLGSNMSIRKPAGGKVGTALDFAPDGESSVTYNTIVDAAGVAATEVELIYKAPGGNGGSGGGYTPPPYIPSGGGGYAPSTPPAQSVTVPISGDTNTIHVGASVSGDKATVSNVALSHLETVIGDHVDTGTVTIDFSGLNSSKPITTVEIPSNVVKEIAEAVSDPNNDAHSFEVILSDGTSIEFDAVALGEKASQADGLDITISIEHHEDAKLTSAQKNAVGNRPAFDINVTSGGKHISDMGGKITVHAPYELKAGEKARGIVVWYVDDHGNRERCETSYDPIKQRVNWKTDHLSLYMIDYDPVLAETCDGGEDCPSAKFLDIDPNAWYHEAIDFILENSLMNGYGNGYFGPNDNLSRGMLAQILYNMEDRPAVSGEIPYTDVAEGKYYVDAIKWAAQNGIVGGYGGGLFGPDDNITREQLATILWRYAQVKGYDVSVGESTNILSYEDAFTISEYAIPAIQWACGDGVMQGSDGYLNPKGSAIRAHVAQMLKNFIENIIK